MSRVCDVRKRVFKKTLEEVDFIFDQLKCSRCESNGFMSFLALYVHQLPNGACERGEDLPCVNEQGKQFDQHCQCWYDNSLCCKCQVNHYVPKYEVVDEDEV